MPLEVAINLAAYVTYQVKRTVKDAGLDTDFGDAKELYLSSRVV
jgi:hypothetical protein